MTRQQRDKKLSALPDALLADCKGISDDLRAGSGETMDEKILTARVRICSGYYDSHQALHTIASRMLSQDIPETDTFLAG
ncbi:hypothetical protein ACFL2Z_03290 [Candidatus Eisenbacteria bacterium]|uniref:Uncharacterized protein n=1 Tax=Eiseniibacteriota bacterium TaxID=2212470 RepID=A0ABV6YPB8_UNCEI